MADGTVRYATAGTTAGSWTHVVIRFDGDDEATVYFHGVEVGAGAAPSLAAAQDIGIGRCEDVSYLPECVGGAIDEIRYFDVAQDDARVAELAGPTAESMTRHPGPSPASTARDRRDDVGRSSRRFDPHTAAA